MAHVSGSEKTKFLSPQFKEKLIPAKEAAEIMEAMIDGVSVVGLDGKVTNVNTAFERLTGYTRSELIGKVPFNLQPERKKEKILAGIEQVMKRGVIRNFETAILRKGKKEIPVMVNAILTRGTDGRPKGLIATFRDTTELKRARKKEKRLAAAVAAREVEKKKAAELRRAYRELKQVQEKLIQSEKMATVGRLAAGVAHEINNPLVTIVLGLNRTYSMLKKQPSDNLNFRECLQNLKKVEKATHQCKRIVAGLLAFSRPTRLQLSTTNINKVVEETLKSLGDQIRAGNVRVVQNFDGQLPKIEADGGQLSQVFSNLIINACEAMPKGGQLRITTRLRETKARVLPGEALPETDKTVEIEFSDTGKGIPQENLLRIFDPFFTTKDVEKGVGLGLSISYGIIELHGGSIEVRSKSGEGATFIIRLPLKIQGEGDEGENFNSR